MNRKYIDVEQHTLAAWSAAGRSWDGLLKHVQGRLREPIIARLSTTITCHESDQSNLALALFIN